MKRTLFLLFMFGILLPSPAFPDNISSGLTVFTPVINERFDWSISPGGNDGLYTLTDYFGALPSSDRISYFNCRRGDQCLEVGASNKEGYLDISNNSDNMVYCTFRMNGRNKKIDLLVGDGDKAGSYLDLKSVFGENEYVRIPANGKKKIRIGSKSSANIKDYNFYIDDLVIYEKNVSKSDIERASRIIVYSDKGLTEEQIAELQEIVAADENLTSVDLLSAGNVSSAFPLTPKNPNCLFFCGTKILTNETNVLLPATKEEDKRFVIVNSFTCADLQIHDGCPFDAMYGFTAVKASYDRSFSVSGGKYFSGVCLPFALKTVPSGVKAYLFSAYSGGTLSFSSAETIEAARPYVVETTVEKPFASLTDVTVPGTTPLTLWPHNVDMSKDQIIEARKYRYSGTFSSLTGEKSSTTCALYGFQGGRFVSVGSDASSAVTFQPLRTYFSVDKVGGAASPALRLGGVLSSVKAPRVRCEEVGMPVYCIDGRTVGYSKDSEIIGTDMPRGIYILGGRKVVIK